ncbi:hypothetical protein AXG93_1335s1190 [Marchantia polymorpha subsp. ruderalis]|uniref:RING-type domain-containing protein n=1 Tax=Marchantia polymorpha subsp. ruderalis TaxID=1480154 RepID=A0A176W6E4_MARPO|nr:hypothetical protein AXG93_1335s1190 [Marchantia polymorpha subsp. ruderalis]
MAEVQDRRADSVSDSEDVDDEEGVTLLEVGNAAFRSEKYDEAIKVYSDALEVLPFDLEKHRGPLMLEPVLLSNRCAAYCKLSERLRKIPAELSEERALFGLDPTSLVQLALKDGEKAIKLRKDWPKAYLRKGTALVLLEQYEGARDAFLDGLQVDPRSTSLQKALRDLNREFGGQLEEVENSRQQKRAKVVRSDELDCTLCLKLLYSPITTPCGHSFCRGCLLQAMDHGNKCPMCRTVLFVSPKTYPVSVTLNNLIQRNFPEEYKERKDEMDEVLQPGKEILPLFVMDVVLPCERMSLNIFEPRYRLMVRRVMEGNHRMGMVGVEERGVLADIGCEVEICECQPLPDGRFYLEVSVIALHMKSCPQLRDVGALASPKHGSKTGGYILYTGVLVASRYRVAQVKWFEDTPLEDGSREKEQLTSLLKGASTLAKTWLQRGLDLQTCDRRAVHDVVKRAESMPDSTQAEAFSFSLANVLIIRPQEKLQLLRTTDTREAGNPPYKRRGDKWTPDL